MSPEHSNIHNYASYEEWKGWDKPFTYTEDKAAYFQGEMAETKIKNGSIFEIGFGSGDFLAWAKENGAKRIAGNELNDVMLKAAIENGIEILPVDFEKMASEYTNAFDAIVAFDVFEHMEIDDISKKLSAIEIMLKPAGFVILRFPNAQSPFGLAPQNGDHTHRSALSKSVLEQLIVSMNLHVVRYCPSFRIKNGTFLKKMVRHMRYVCRSIISKTLNFIFAQNIPWDPVVVVVMQKNLDH